MGQYTVFRVYHFVQFVRYCLAVHFLNFFCCDAIVACRFFSQSAVGFPDFFTTDSFIKEIACCLYYNIISFREATLVVFCDLWFFEYSAFFMRGFLWVFPKLPTVSLALQGVWFFRLLFLGFALKFPPVIIWFFSVVWPFLSNWWHWWYFQIQSISAADFFCSSDSFNVIPSSRRGFCDAFPAALEVLLFEQDGGHQSMMSQCGH